eukprot:633067-Rhodomonas_salina.1
MARVADVRRLGLGGPAQPAVRNRGPVSRTGKSLTASLPRASTDVLAVMRSNSEQVLRVPENSKVKSAIGLLLRRAMYCADLADAGSNKSCTGPDRGVPFPAGGDLLPIIPHLPFRSGADAALPLPRSQPSSASFGPVVQFDEPVSDDARRAAQHHRERAGGAGAGVGGFHLDQNSQQQHSPAARHEHKAEREPEEDLFAVLQRRIAAQRSELQQHRADITNAIEQDVQYVSPSNPALPLPRSASSTPHHHHLFIISCHPHIATPALISQSANAQLVCLFLIREAAG